MPFSSNSGKHLVDRAVQRISESCKDNTRINVLDIGVGSGTYFNRYGNTLLAKPKANWLGIEIWEPYIAKYGLQSKYDQILKQDARIFAQEAGKTCTVPYDICFVGDVAEHMTKEEAVEMIKALSLFCKCIIMSIPIIHYPQGEYDGNPYEAHVKDDWSHKEVIETFGDLIAEYGVENEIGVYFMAVDYMAVVELLKPKIAVYAICKNEEQFAERFAKSVKDADYLVVCDTGSKDDTKRWLRFTREDAKCKTTITDIHVSPWRFDDARNAALMLIHTDADLCISLDLDEYLQPDWYQILCTEINTHYRTRGKLYDKYNCRFQTIWDWRTIESDDKSVNTSTHWHERIHTRHNWKWRLPVHEILTYTGYADHKEEWAWLGGFMMTQKPDMKPGKHSYLPLIEQSVKEDPRVWKSWTFLAQEYMTANRRQDAIDALKKALALPDCDKAYVSGMLGSYYEPIDQMEASRYYSEACALSPFSREKWVTLAQYCQRTNMPGQAEMAIRKAKSCTTPSTGYDYTAWCWGPTFDALYNGITGEKE